MATQSLRRVSSRSSDRLGAILTVFSPRTLVDIANPRRVGLISIAHGLNEFYAIVLPPLFPLIVTDLDISYAEAGLLVTVFFVMYSVFQLPAGILADRVGKFRLVILGLVGVSVGVLIASLAPNYPALIAAQIIAGISGSTYHPAGMSLISDLENTETEGRAMGIHGFAGQLGVAGAPLLLGGLTTVVSWRMALAVASVVGLAGVGLVWLGYSPSAEAPRSDGGRSSERSSTDVTVRDRIVSAIRVPLSTWLALLFLIHVLVSMLVRTVQTFTTTYLFANGNPTATANAIFAVLLVGSSVSSLWVGDLADRMNRRRLGIGFALSAAGMFVALPFLAGFLSLPMVILWYFALGLMIYGISPVKNALAATYSESEYSGSVFGVLQTASALGSALGPAVFGFLADRYSIDVAYPSIAGICLLIAILFLFLLRRDTTTATEGL